MQCRQGEKSATSFVQHYHTVSFQFGLLTIRYLAQVFFDNSHNLGEPRQLSDFLRMDDLDNIFDLEVPKILTVQNWKAFPFKNTIRQI